MLVHSSGGQSADRSRFGCIDLLDVKCLQTSHASTNEVLSVALNDGRSDFCNGYP